MDQVSVFIVDDTSHLRSIVRTIVEATDGFEFAGEAADGRTAVEAVLRVQPDIVLMDVEMPGLDGRTATGLLTMQSPNTKIIAWTNHEEAPIITEMIAAGACGYLLKGTPPREFIDALKWAAEGQSVLSRDLTSTVLQELSRLYRDAEQRAQELKDSYLATVASLAAALETKDDQTGNHARRVRDYASLITKAFDPTLLDEDSLSFGYLLHDVGKIGIPEHILLKPGPLTSEEWELMRRHPEMGAHILSTAEFLHPHGIEVVIAHHERWDGTGYPYSRSRESIPVGARLFSVADAFDAMTSDRPYRSAMPADHAIEEIIRNSGAQFDPDVVRAFRDVEGDIHWRLRADREETRDDALTLLP